MSTQRLSRKEIKHDVRDDAFKHGVEASYEYVKGHQRNLVMSIVGALVVVAAIAGFVTWRHAREQKADDLLGQAIRTYDAQVVPTGAKPDDAEAPTFADEASRTAKAKAQFEKLRDQYSSTGAAAVAAVYLGRIHVQQGDVAGARKLWQEFLDDHSKPMMAAAVRLSLIELDRSSGKGQQVVDTLRADLEKDDKPLPEDVLLYQLGTTLEQLGRRDEARTAYQRISDEYPDSPWASKAQGKVRELAPGGVPALTVGS
jgi:predicted negative regulator of RcsB-dependent stress response